MYPYYSTVRWKNLKSWACHFSGSPAFVNQCPRNPSRPIWCNLCAARSARSLLSACRSVLLADTGRYEKETFPPKCFFHTILPLSQKIRTVHSQIWKVAQWSNFSLLAKCPGKKHHGWDSAVLKTKRPDCHFQGNPAVYSKTRGFLSHSHEWFSIFLLCQVITRMTGTTQVVLFDKQFIDPIAKYTISIYLNKLYICLIGAQP